MNALEHSIVALSSGAGRAGIAVVRMSGPHSSAALQRLAGELPPPRRASLRRIRDPGSRAVIDQGLVLWLPGPDSFTGEDMAEFHVHGGRAVVSRLQEVLLGEQGVRLAEAGEFSRRAFDNGKLDLAAVEGLADVINAETEAQRRQAVRQMGGALGRQCAQWRDTVLSCLAHVEAELDFSDEEDVPASPGETLATALAQICEDMTRALESGRQGERLREGVFVAIAGPPNAGKSTLLNALARRDAAIVSEVAGTTRDVIEVHMDLSGYPLTLVDMAGLRAATDTVEQEGVRRARTAIERADIVLWLQPCDDSPVGQDDLGCAGDRLVKRVLSKADVAVCDGKGAAADTLRLSARTGEGLEALSAWLEAQAAELCGGGQAAIVTRARHRAALEDCRRALMRYISAPHAASELQAEDLRAAAQALGRITGGVDVEDVLDLIFRDFCIGK